MIPEETDRHFLSQEVPDWTLSGRQAGDSLAGRYFLYHLNPLTVRELSGTMAPYEIVSALNKLGGFPEPFLSTSDEYAGRWRQQYYTDIVREDIMDFSSIHEIRSIRILLEMLRRRVSSTVSYSSLAEDLQRISAWFSFHSFSITSLTHQNR